MLESVIERVREGERMLESPREYHRGVRKSVRVVAYGRSRNIV